MKITSRHACLMILMVFLATMIAACGGGGGGAATTPAAGGGAATSAPAAGGGATAAPAAGAGAATSAPAAGGGTSSAGGCPDSAKGQTVTMWSPLTGPDGKFLTDLAARFSQESGITVNHLPQPDYLQKLNTAAAGKVLPEMTIIRAGDIAEMAARNVLKPISAEALNVAGGDALKSDFPQQIWNAGEYKGQHYTVPLDVHPFVLYYNKDLFQKAGLPLPGAEPMSKADFEKAAETLNKDGVAGVSIGTAFQAGALFQMLIRQFGGSVASEDGWQATYNSDAGVQALTYINDLKKKYSPSVSGGGDPEVKVFQQGKAAMVMHGPWHISDMQKLGFVGFAPVPKIGNEYAVWGGSHQFGMTTDDPAKQAAAACWIGWASKNSAEWAKAGQVPIRKSVREQGNLESIAPPIAAIKSEADAVVMLPSAPGLEPAAWGEGFGKAADAVLLGQQTDIKKALDDAAAKTNQIMQQNKQKYGG